MSTFDFVTSVMEQATRKINEQHERIEELQFETAKLREELQQSEDRFRSIPDEVWSKADLVEMTNKVLEERDDAHKQIVALRENRDRLVKTASEVLEAFVLHKKVETGHPCPENMCICIDLRAAIDAACAKETQP